MYIYVFINAFLNFLTSRDANIIHAVIVLLLPQYRYLSFEKITMYTSPPLLFYWFFFSFPSALG